MSKLKQLHGKSSIKEIFLSLSLSFFLSLFSLSPPLFLSHSSPFSLLLSFPPTLNQKFPPKPYIFRCFCCTTKIEKQGSHGSQKLSSIKSLKIENPTTDTGHIPSTNHQKNIPYQILGDKTVENVQIDPQQRRYG